MITQMNADRRRRGRPVPPLGITSQNVGGLMLSTLAALILLPAIGIKGVVKAFVPAKSAPANPDLRPPFYGWND